MQRLLRGVSRFVDRAERPAAYACRVVQDQLNDTIDLGTVRIEHSRKSAARPADHEGTLAGADSSVKTDPSTELAVTATQGARAAQVAAGAYPTSTQSTVAVVPQQSAGSPAVVSGSAHRASPSRAVPGMDR